MDIIRQINNLIYFYILTLIKTQYLLIKVFILNIILYITLRYNYSIILPPVINFLIFYVLYLSFRVDRRYDFYSFYKMNNIPEFLVFIVKFFVISVLYLISFFILLKFQFLKALNIDIKAYLLNSLAFFTAMLYTYNKSLLLTGLIFICISVVNFLVYYIYSDILILLFLHLLTIIIFLVFNIKKIYDQI
jgi:hypothetical protein